MTSHGQEGVYQSGNRTVAVYATVTGPDGRLVPDLTEEAFAIDDNGKRQEITLFANSIQPITAVVLLDRSGSMRANFRLVEQAAAQFVEALGPDDRVASAASRTGFNRSPRLHIGSRRAAHHTPLGAAARGPDALVERDLRRDHGAAAPAGTAGDSRVYRWYRQPARRRWSGNSLRDVMRRAEEEDVMVYAIGLAPASGGIGQSGPSGPSRPGGPSGGRGRPGMRPPPFLNQPDPGLPKIAAATGGGYLELTSANDLAVTFARVADELHHQYVLGFAPSSLDGKMHSLDVQVDGAGMKARARKSYLARAVR